MSLDSNQNADREPAPYHWGMRILLAVVLSVAIAGFVGATAWSAGYSQAELSALQTSEETKIQELRNQEITQLRIALGRRSPTNRRADLYLRLAEIYLEAYRSTYLLEGRVHEKRIESGRNESAIDHSHSRPYLSSGIQACSDILRLKIQYEKMDQVYYFLGFANGELGNRKESIRYFELLTGHYPQSQLVSEAYRELGEDAFERASFRKAVEYYQNAVKREQGDRVARTLHKLAWSYYRVKQYGQAVETMKQAVAAASKNDKYLSLREEALRDMAIFMTETGRVEEALSYFQNVAGDKGYYPKALEKLGRQYERNAEPQKAVQVYEALLKTRPDDEAAFRARAKLVDLDLRRGQYASALNRIKGGKIFTTGESETLTASQNLRAMIRRTATEQHEQYRKKSNKVALGVAESFYSAYLETFLSQDDPRSERPEIQMYLAEVKRELGKDQEASALYRKVLDSKDKRYAKEAGALWTASLADAIRKTPRAQASTPIAGEPTAMERQFVEAADDMQRALGDMPEAREAALKSAQVLAGYPSAQKEALGRAREISIKWPRTIQGVNGGRLWVQVLGDRLPSSAAALDVSSSAVSDLKDAMKELRENALLMQTDQENGGKLKALMADMDNRIKIGLIASQERDKDFASAAKGYEAFAGETSKRDIAEKAYANAVSSYIRAGDSASAERVTSVWLQRFPGSKAATDALRSAGTQALIKGNYASAAALLERIGLSGVDPDALATAARLYEGSGNIPAAQSDWSKYFSLYPNSEKRWAIALQLARSFEAAGNDGEAGKTYKYCLAGPPEVEAECGARLADLYFRLQTPDQAKAVLKRVAQQKKTPFSPFVAYARYKLAELGEREASFDKLQLPEEKLKKGLNQRLAFVEPLSRAYLSAVDAGGPWAVAALDRMALWVMNFADEIDAIPSSQTEGSAAAKKFRESLTSISAPLRAKAIETWKTAYDKAASSGYLSPALPAVYDHLVDARASGVFRAQGFRGKFRLGGVPADGGAEGHEGAIARVREKLLRSAQDAGAWVDYGNLLWGEAHPLLARIAYDRALALDGKNPGALNNRGVVVVMTALGEEDWFNAIEARGFFELALKQDEFFLPAKQNLALLLNYYRVFAKAKPLWEQIIARAANAEAQDGLAIALQGTGNLAVAEATFKKSTDAGESSRRFSLVYHEAARQSVTGREGAERCQDRLGDLDPASLQGFEKEAVERLKRTCETWKNTK